MENICNLQTPTPFLMIFCIVFYSFILLTTSHRISKDNNLLRDFVLLCLFCVFSFQDTDWFHYAEIYKDYSTPETFDFSYYFLFEKTEYSHMERIYSYLAYFSSKSYLLFRLIIWGSALVLFFLSCKNWGVKISYVLYYFVPLFLLLFCYGRVSLAFSMAFYGYSLISKNFGEEICNQRILNTKRSSISLILSTVVGGLFIIASLLFHKSVGILLPVFVISVIPLTKKTILAYMFLFVLVFFAVKNIQNYLTLFDLQDSLTISSLQYELENKKTSDSGSLLRLFITYYLKYLPYYLFLFYQIKDVYSNKTIEIPVSIKLISNCATLLILIATAFLLAGLYTFFYRFIMFSMIPISIFLAYSHPFAQINRGAIFRRIGIFLAYYKLLYILYLANAGAL